jgi:hypothetical protein
MIWLRRSTVRKVRGYGITLPKLERDICLNLPTIANESAGPWIY